MQLKFGTKGSRAESLVQKQEVKRNKAPSNWKLQQKKMSDVRHLIKHLCFFFFSFFFIQTTNSYVHNTSSLIKFKIQNVTTTKKKTQKQR